MVYGTFFRVLCVRTVSYTVRLSRAGETAAAVPCKAEEDIGTRRHRVARGCRTCKLVVQGESDRSPTPSLPSPSTPTHPSCVGSEEHTQVSTARRNLPLVSLFSADIRVLP